jgi:hypothetical protein
VRTTDPLVNNCCGLPVNKFVVRRKFVVRKM